MNKLLIQLCFSSLIFAGIFPLPSDINLKIGTGYNSNYFRFSDSEIIDIGLDHSILGDSPTFDTGILKSSLKITYDFELIKSNPTKFSVETGISNYQQSKSKKYYQLKLFISHRIKNYQWIKLGYYNIPNNYLRMYADKDQIGNPLLYFISYSHPLIYNTWGKVKYNKSTLYFNRFFTEFDMETQEFELKIQNKYYKRFSFSNWITYSISENISYASGLISTGTDRSYVQFQIGSRINFKPNNLFLDKLQTTLIWYTRDYISTELTDHLHVGRTHNQLSIQCLREYFF